MFVNMKSNMSDKKIRLLMVAVISIWLILCQSLFYLIQNSLGEKIIGALQNQLRQELEHSNFHFLARSINDYNQSGSISCAVVTRQDKIPEIIVDLRYLSSSCHYPVAILSALLAGSHQGAYLKALNGDVFFVQFRSNNPNLFYFSLWGFRFLGVAAIIASILGFIAYREKERVAVQAELAIANEIRGITQQVAHDIRSPLTALQIVTGTLGEIDQEKRSIIESATNRINSIANDLLVKGKEIESGETVQRVEKSPEGYNLKLVYLPLMLETLFTEKRIQFQKNTNIQLGLNLIESYESFALVNVSDLGRAISNLINNSVEAVEEKKGVVIVSAKTFFDNDLKKIEISIKDNGKGIPNVVLKRLGQRGVTYGKSKSLDKSGSGLGVHYAKKIIDKHNGNFQIDSTLGVGTNIKMTLNLQDTPKWFLKEINLRNKKNIVFLTEDNHLEVLWQNRILATGLEDIQILSFSKIADFKDYFYKNINKMRQTLYVIDNELGLSAGEGQAVISELAIESYTVLIVDEFEHLLSQHSNNNLKYLLLLKSQRDRVPIVTT